MSDNLPDTPLDSANKAADTGEGIVHEKVVPDFAERIVEAVERIADNLSGVTQGEEKHEEAHEEKESEPVVVEEVEETDASPVSIPWTHRNPFHKRDE